MPSEHELLQDLLKLQLGRRQEAALGEDVMNRLRAGLGLDPQLGRLFLQRALERQQFLGGLAARGVSQGPYGEEQRRAFDIGQKLAVLAATPRLGGPFRPSPPPPREVLPGPAAEPTPPPPAGPQPPRPRPVPEEPAERPLLEDEFIQRVRRALRAQRAFEQQQAFLRPPPGAEGEMERRRAMAEALRSPVATGLAAPTARPVDIRTPAQVFAGAFFDEGPLLDLPTEQVAEALIRAAKRNDVVRTREAADILKARMGHFNLMPKGTADAEALAEGQVRSMARVLATHLGMERMGGLSTEDWLLANARPGELSRALRRIHGGEEPATVAQEMALAALMARAREQRERRAA